MFGLFKKKSATPARRGQRAGSPPDDDAARPTRRKIEYLQRMFDALTIGSRITYLPEYTDSKFRVETLVIGYRINEHAVFRARDVEFIHDEPGLRLRINTRHGPETLTRIEEIKLLIPGDTKAADRQLDLNARAALGGRGSLGRGTRLTLVSTALKESNQKVEVEVERHTLLTEGPHKGMHVAVLDVMLGTLEEHEPRKQTRIPCHCPAEVTRDDSEQLWAATVLDYSESSMRLRLDHDDAKWPRFDKGRLANIRFSPAPDKPPLMLRCTCLKARDREAIFRMDYIVRAAGIMPFETVDALEIKIDLMKVAEGAT